MKIMPLYMSPCLPWAGAGGKLGMGTPQGLSGGQIHGVKAGIAHKRQGLAVGGEGDRLKIQFFPHQLGQVVYGLTSFGNFCPVPRF